jgi:hypothetical protein
MKLVLCFVFVFAKGMEGESQLNPDWTEFICISIDKNYFALLSLIYNSYTSAQG